MTGCCDPRCLIRPHRAASYSQPLRIVDADNTQSGVRGMTEPSTKQSVRRACGLARRSNTSAQVEGAFVSEPNGGGERLFCSARTNCTTGSSCSRPFAAIGSIVWVIM